MGAIDGLISGLNTTQIITQLMQVERLPEQQLTNHKTASQTLVSSMQSLNSLFTALQTAAKAFVPDSITKQSAWGSTTGTSSASTLASVTTGPAAQPGSARFTVTSVASAGSAVSAKTVGALTTPVASGPFLLTKGAGSLGLSAVDAGADLSTGSHQLTVTQASAAATLTGQNVLPPAVTIDGTNNTVSFYVDGAAAPTSVTLDAGRLQPGPARGRAGPGLRRHPGGRGRLARQPHRVQRPGGVRGLPPARCPEHRARPGRHHHQGRGRRRQDPARRGSRADREQHHRRSAAHPDGRQRHGHRHGDAGRRPAARHGHDHVGGRPRPGHPE